MSFAHKTQAELDRQARMFAVEHAVKFGSQEGVPPVETARAFYDFISEAPAQDPPFETGFTLSHQEP